jgi:hypothetical protein
VPIDAGNRLNRASTPSVLAAACFIQPFPVCLVCIENTLISFPCLPNYPNYLPCRSPVEAYSRLFAWL